MTLISVLILPDLMNIYKNKNNKTHFFKIAIHNKTNNNSKNFRNNNKIVISTNNNNNNNNKANQIKIKINKRKPGKVLLKNSNQNS